MRIAVFDYKIRRTNPIGGCHLNMLSGLCHEHDFTVFAVEFENPNPERIRWIRIPAPRRPLALLFVVYHILAPVYYFLFRLVHRERFDLVQVVESNLGYGDVSYAHFCHRAYLREHWREAGPSGFHGFMRWLDHRLHALVEPFTYRRTRAVVVPSRGLQAELVAEYSVAKSKIHLIPNPVDIERMSRPERFDVGNVRQELGIGATDIMLVFVALGHFERKGLPLLLTALGAIEDPSIRLLVVGGERDLVATWQKRVVRAGLQGRVLFTGFVSDVRKYLWAADAYVSPSRYEIFSLASLEAAAAGVVLVVTRIYGVEEFVQDGQNGFMVDHDPAVIAATIRRVSAMSPEARAAMGKQAARDVERYSREAFVSAWRDFYEQSKRGA